MDWELLADQPLGQKLIKKWFWLYFFAYLSAPAGYLIKVIVSNSISVADVGVLYTIFSLITILNVYNDLGLTESLQYFLPRYRVKKQYDYIKTSIYLSLVVQILTATIIAIFLRFGAPRLSIHYFHSPEATTILKYFCLYFLWINIFQVLQSVFMAFQDTFNYQFTEMTRNWAIVWFTFFFFITGQWNISNYSLNWVLWLGVGIIIALIIFWRKYKRHILQWKIVVDKPMVKEYVKYALWCFLWLNVSMLFGQILQQVVIIMIWAEAAGYYTNFTSLFSIVAVIVWPIMWLIFPMVSELVSKKDTKKLSSLFDFFYTYFSVFSFSLAVLFIVLWPEMAMIIFGNKFILSGELLSWGAIFIVCNTLFSFNYWALAGLWKIKERVKLLSIVTVLTITTSVLLIPLRWIYGALVWFCFSQLSLLILSYHLLCKTIHVSINRFFVIKNIIFTSIIWIIIRYIKSNIFVFNDLMRYSNLWKLVVLCVAFYIVFGAFNYKKIIILKDEIKKLKNS